MRSISGRVISPTEIPLALANEIASLTRSSISILEAMNSAVAGTLALRASRTELRPDKTSLESAAFCTRRPVLVAPPAFPAVLVPGARNSPFLVVVAPGFALATLGLSDALRSFRALAFAAG